MDRNYLQEIVLDQFEELKRKKRGFLRHKLKEITSLVNRNTNIVITGHRRAGKSTFLYQLMDTYHKDDFYYLDFSDDRLSNFETDDFQKLVEIYVSNFKEKKIYFFDEIQGKPNWNKFVNRMYSQGCKFYITGSNSELLSKEISTYLTGRHIDVTLFPFSFSEYLDYKQIDSDYNYSKNKLVIIKELENYIKLGGFPESIIYSNTDLLKTVYLDVINKDILIRHKIKDSPLLKKIILYLISNIGKEFSYNGIKNNFNLGSPNTSRKYINYITDTYMLFELAKYDYSIKKQETYSKKIYCIDTGLVNKISFSFSENIGRLYENIVFIELLRREKEVYYWKDTTNKEVDFITLNKQKVDELIQVCYDLSNIQTKEREISSLIVAMDYFKLNKGTIITSDLEKVEKKDKKEIKYVPLWKWLLEKHKEKVS